MDDKKYRTCQDCPDRTVEPNCHTACEGYLFRVQKSIESKKLKNQNVDFGEFKREAIIKTKRRMGRKT